MAYKLIDAAQARWRKINAPELVALVRVGAIFHKGKLLERPCCASVSNETKTAKGIYVIVTMTLKNNTGTAVQMFGSDQVLRDSAGLQFSAGGNNNDNSSSVVQKGPTGVDIVEPAANLDPAQEMTVGVMFDVPEGTKPSQIVLKEMRPGNNPPLENPYGMVVNLS